jgi:5'-3' exonuclease
MPKRLMIVDSLNLFIRNYVVDPSMSTHGQPLGGLKGYFKSLQKLIRDVKPDGIVVVWDGPGGSRKKKTIIKDYKDGRKPIRLNRDVKNLTEDQEIQNKVWQQLRVIEYLNCMPIVQFLEREVEADDLISVVARHEKFKDWDKVIVSSDKDFIQLCNKNTVLYRPIQNEVLTTKKVLEEFKIHPNNFAVARAMAGDASDNIDGVKGLGLTTIANRMPFLAEEKEYLTGDVFEFCKKQIEEGSKLKLFQNILDASEDVHTNYTVMQLSAPNLSFQVLQKVDYALDNYNPEFNLTEVRKMMIEDGFGEVKFDELYAALKKIIAEHKGL